MDSIGTIDIVYMKCGEVHRHSAILEKVDITKETFNGKYLSSRSEVWRITFAEPLLGEPGVIEMQIGLFCPGSSRISTNSDLDI